ncbi:MAG: peptidylprolyl isomerase [Hyphomicrobiales bacterium]
MKTLAIGVVAAVGILAAAQLMAADAPAKKAAATGSSDEVAILDTSKGRMVLEFWDKDAPQTVANFKKLARQGFFDGTGFHRIIKGFMIQGGDPKSKNPKATDLGTGDPGYKIKDEFNAHHHVKGVISMANSGTPNSAGSQFFIVQGPATFLDGKYTAFGHVIQGMDVLDAIANVPVGPNPMMGGERSKPLEWVTLKSVKIVPRSSLAAAGKAKAEEAKAAGAEKAAAAKTKADEAKSAGQAKAEAAKEKAASEAAKAAPEAAKAAPDSAMGGHK